MYVGVVVGMGEKGRERGERKEGRKKKKEKKTSKYLLHYTKEKEVLSKFLLLFSHILDLKKEGYDK